MPQSLCTSSAQEQKESLAALAREQGFELFGVAAAQPPPHADAFRRWIDAGRHASMEWLARSVERRSDPALVLPGIRSVICLGVSYWQGGKSRVPSTSLPSLSPLEQGATGRIARYAWGGDYHDWILERLRPLERQIADWGETHKSYTDTGPILERDFAALAGLGWQGKSTMLIHRKVGTWFFLAEILTTLALPPDPPETDHCGKCTACITACPTGAITAPHELDARRCLSYWTIEHKGSIPEEFREALGDRIYGCDDCLDACPWNRWAQATREAHFHAPPGLRERPLRWFLELDDAGFRELFRGSPIKRIKRSRFLRNVCLALGNVGDASDLAALTQAAGDPDPLIAEAAEWALQKVKRREYLRERRNPATNVPSNAAPAKEGSGTAVASTENLR